MPHSPHPRAAGADDRSACRGPFRLDPSTGGFRDAAGHAIVPMGVNYWPASCGVEMWAAWPEAEIRSDLALVRRLGLNCVRWFLRWQDFEPREGEYDEKQFERLRELLCWHREEGVVAHPSLFVGWMSGGIFWPQWHREENVFSSQRLRERAVAFARKVAAVCREFADVVLAIDLGNELCCLPASHSASPTAVATWARAVVAAAKEGFPDGLVVSGNEQTQVAADSGWRLDRDDGCDFLSMHGYPIAAWHPLGFDGMTDPLGQEVLAFYVKCARAFGPVLVQEFGTLYTAGASQTDAYLRAMLPACRDAGANGFLWWCLRDIASNAHPYAKNPFERGMGLVDVSGKPKAGLGYFLEFARALAQEATIGAAEAGKPKDASSGTPGAPTVGLYWPEQYYDRENPLNPGNAPRALARRMLVANHALIGCGHRPAVMRSNQLARIGGGVPLVIAGACVTRTEVLGLTEWVRGGGRMIWHGVDPFVWDAAAVDLLGASAVDFRQPVTEGVSFGGRAWSFRQAPRDTLVEVLPGTARVAAVDQSGRPVILTNRVGQGIVVACLAQPDDDFAAEAPVAARRPRWSEWYRAMLALLD